MYHGLEIETTEMLDSWITLLNVGVILLIHLVASHLSGLEEVHKEVIDAHLICHAGCFLVIQKCVKRWRSALKNEL